MPTLRRLPRSTSFKPSAFPFVTAALASVPLLLSASALAQTSVTVYGIVDAGLVSEHGGVGGSVNKLTSGVGSISRLGFKGTEDLGGGMSALFVLETGLKLDTGEQDVAGSIFNRQAFVGLKNAFGTFTLGRQYTPYYTTLVNVADPFGGGYAGTAKNLFPTVGNNTRTSNTLMLASPVIAGFSGEVSYALGEQAGSNKNQRQFGAAIGYANGPAAIRLAYLNKNNDAAAVPAAGATPAVAAVNRDLGTNTLLAGNYDFGVAKAYLAYGTPFGPPRPTASTDSTDLLAGVSVPFGSTTLLASYTRKNDRTAFNQDATQWAIGGLYALTKRTSLYASYARIDNKNGAGYTVGNNAEAGSGDRAINAGVRHTF
jgi:GBP family porin